MVCYIWLHLIRESAQHVKEDNNFDLKNIGFDMK